MFSAVIKLRGDVSFFFLFFVSSALNFITAALCTGRFQFCRRIVRASHKNTIIACKRTDGGGVFVYFPRADGVVCTVFPHLSAGCPSLMAVEAPLVPTVLIDVTQYCIGRQGLLLCNSDMLITTPFSAQKGENCPAAVVRPGLELMVSSANVWNYLLLKEFVCKCAVTPSMNNVFPSRLALQIMGMFFEWIWMSGVMWNVFGWNGKNKAKTETCNLLFGCSISFEWLDLSPCVCWHAMNLPHS